MASRPSRTAHKRYINVTRALMKDISVVFVAGKNDNQVLAWQLKRGRPEKVTAVVAQAFADGLYPWLLHCAVTGRRQDGQQYMKMEVLAPPHPVRQSQIAASCNELHNQMLKNFNPAHRLTAGWVGTTSGEELPEEQVDEILTKCGAYDFAAAWEG